MARLTAITATVVLVCVSASACESVLGSVDVAPAPPSRAAAPSQPANEAAPPAAVSDFLPVFEAIPDPSLLPSPDAGSEVFDAAVPASPPDGGEPPVIVPEATSRAVIVDSTVAAALVGAEGGGPRLGVCDQGVVIGVRPTANPGEDIFGQRLTFLEPICGAARADVASGVVRVMRDDSRLRWETTGDFEGVPATEVPDERLIWLQQPEALCPDSAPVLVGLSGEYDPVAPDATDTAAIRSLVMECAPLAVTDNGIDVAADAAGHQLVSRADSFSASGAQGYRSACEGGAVITQLQLHAGFWLDGFVLGCSSLRSVRDAGAACSADRECQSLCAADGTCAP